jgi:hypothetical protein
MLAEEDGFGVFWSIVHFLEATNGYEEVLVESVLRNPTEFNLLMVNRLINGGVLSVAGQSLPALLREVALRQSVSPRAREVAGGFVKYQEQHGHGEA